MRIRTPRLPLIELSTALGQTIHEAAEQGDNRHPRGVIYLDTTRQSHAFDLMFGHSNMGESTRAEHDASASLCIWHYGSQISHRHATGPVPPEE
jgi:hypothetical protein